MRRNTWVLGGVSVSILALFAAHGCGKDPDTPTPTRPAYAHDDIDAVPTTERVVLPALQEPVRVIRDKRGMIHVYARNLHDAALAQGFLMARDRAPQMELLRRVAEGRLAAALGQLDTSLAARDITMRAMGLRRTADKYYASLKDGSDAKVIVDGFAQGVTAFYRDLRSKKAQIPNGWLVIPREKYTDWEPQSTLAIARLQTWSLSYWGDDELEYTETLQKAQDTFKSGAADAALAKRAGFAVDALRFEPLEKRTVIDGPAPTAPAFRDLRPGGVAAPRVSPALWASVRPTLAAMKATRDFMGKGGWSSNNWAVSPQKSQSGAAMVASDPHLGRLASSIFYMSALHVLSDDPSKRFDVGGMAFAGIPGVVLGFNQHIAWGATVAAFDVQDAYRDVIKDGKVTLKGEDGSPRTVAVEPIKERINYGNGPDVEITLETIPGHGVVLPTIEGDRWVARKGDEALAMRWTGMEPSGEFEAFMALNRAKSVDEALTAMLPFQVGAQNFVFADDEGHIGYTTHSWVPTRPKAALAWDAKAWSGQLPCLVMPGDAGLEWNGRLTDAQLPHAKDPAAGYVATANSDQYGFTFDNDPSNDPFFLACNWDYGLRQKRARDLLDAKDKHDLADMARIQGDARSPLGARVGRFFIDVLERAESTRLGVKPVAELEALVKDPRYDVARVQYVLSILKSWRDKADFDTPAAVVVAGDTPPTGDDVTASQATLVFNAAMIALHNRALDDEWTAMGKPPWGRDFRTKTLLRMLEKPEKLATDDGSGESALWDDLATKDVVETRDQQMLLSLLEALDWLVKTYGADPDKWRWGLAHAITFKTLLTGTERQLSIPGPADGFPDAGFPRHGDEGVLDRADYGLGNPGGRFKFTYSSGPAQRFVAQLAKGALEIRNALPGGNVWRPGEKNFDDEAQLWRRNQNAKVVFTPGEVVPEAAVRIDLAPF
ncbi:MAG: penicillin acylase family protein [Deltaproteobacteria bacterium]|nr:penicillin acylase family protein [Deltaproteobacteria bacterium]